MIFKMPCWFYDKQALFSTPSIQDGIDHKTECQYRKEGAQLIIQIGSQMELGCNTLATGVVYFHRFYMFHSFKTFSPYITACCCLFLAGKAEETPKKSKDIIKIAKKFLTEDKLLTLGENPREEVMTMEKILLQTMKFDLKVRHPYGYLLKYAKCLKGDKRKLHKMVQMAWTFINDSLHTTLSIQWEPEIIAIAMLYLAGKLVRFNVMGWNHRRPSQKYWWEIIVEDLSIEVVEDICHQVLDLYSPMGRYVVIEPPKAVIVKPQNSVNSHSSSCTVNTDIKTNVTHQSFSNSVNSDVTAPAIPLKDPRLESGSVFVKNEFHNTSNTPVLVTSSNLLPGTLSPATPTAPQTMVQQLQQSPQAFEKSNLSLATENHLHEESRFSSFNGSMFEKGFNNDTQSIDNRGFGFTNSINNNNNNDYTDNRSMRHRGFGFMNNNNSDYRENRSFGRRGFRNYDGNNQSGRFRRPSFERNTNGDDHIENRQSENRGFGNSNNYNGRYNENRPLGKRGFGRANNDDETKLPWTRGFGKSDNNNDTKPLWSRGFGNGNNNDEAKPLGTRGFGNADHYNNDCNDNDPRRRMRFNRGNRFQRSDTYPRRFNNNYERDRYSHNDGNRDASKDCVSDAPGKIVDKQRFYRPNNENVNNDNKEEESWD